MKRKKILEILIAAAFIVSSIPLFASVNVNTGGSGGQPITGQAIAPASVTAATGTFNYLDLQQSTLITFPRVTYIGGGNSWQVTTVAIAWNGTDFNTSGPAGFSDKKYCVFADSRVSTTFVGTESALNSPEPVTITSIRGLDGTVDLDAILATINGDPVTFITAATETAGFVLFLQGQGGILDDIIYSIYSHPVGFNPNNPPAPFTAAYTLNLNNITAAGATLWGGDGAGGERTNIQTGTVDLNGFVIDGQGRVGVGINNPTFAFGVKSPSDEITAEFVANQWQSNNIIEADDYAGNPLTVVQKDGTLWAKSQIITASNTIWIELAYTPGHTEACYQGQIRYDANYIYVCTTNNVWKRATLNTY